MQKIASPKDLQAELQRILAYSQEKNPSREKIASELNGLADRVADNHTAASTYTVLPGSPHGRGLSEYEGRVFQFLRKNPAATKQKVQREVGGTGSTVERALGKLVRDEFIKSKLASELRELADRTAKTEVEIRNPRDIARAYQKLPTNPKIYWDIYGSSIREIEGMGLTGKFSGGGTVYMGTHMFRSGGWSGRDEERHMPLTFIGWRR